MTNISNLLPAHAADLSDVEQAIARLSQEYGAIIYGVALRNLRSASAAEDVRNETLLRTIQALRAGLMRQQAALPGFVRGIARNVMREHYRCARRYTSPVDLDPPAPARERRVDHTELRALALTLQRLNPREREIIRCIYYDGLSSPEISQRLAIKPERVRLVKSRALQSSREIYSRVTERRGPCDAAPSPRPA